MFVGGKDNSEAIVLTPSLNHEEINCISERNNVWKACAPDVYNGAILAKSSSARSEIAEDRSRQFLSYHLKFAAGKTLLHQIWQQEVHEYDNEVDYAYSQHTKPWEVYNQATGQYQHIWMSSTSVMWRLIVAETLKPVDNQKTSSPPQSNKLSGVLQGLSSLQLPSS